MRSNKSAGTPRAPIGKSKGRSGSPKTGSARIASAKGGPLTPDRTARREPVREAPAAESGVRLETEVAKAIRDRDELADQVTTQLGEIEVLRSRIAGLEELAAWRPKEADDMVHAATLEAQSIRQEAQLDADQIIEQARERASMVHREAEIEFRARLQRIADTSQSNGALRSWLTRTSEADLTDSTAAESQTSEPLMGAEPRTDHDTAGSAKPKEGRSGKAKRSTTVRRSADREITTESLAATPVGAWAAELRPEDPPQIEPESRDRMAAGPASATESTSLIVIDIGENVAEATIDTRPPPPPPPPPPPGEKSFAGMWDAGDEGVNDTELERFFGGELDRTEQKALFES